MLCVSVNGGLVYEEVNWEASFARLQAFARDGRVGVIATLCRHHQQTNLSMDVTMHLELFEFSSNFCDNILLQTNSSI